MSEGTIYFATPDSNDPWGGVRQIYRVVDILNGAGRPAAVLHTTPGFRCTWFVNESTIRYTGDVTASRADVLVLPERWARQIPNGLAPGIPKIIFNQNHFNTFTNDVTAKAAKDIYTHEDVKGVVVVSEHGVDFFRYAFPDLRVERMRCGVDPNLYHPNEPKSRAVAYMPRKRRQEATDVLSLLNLRGALKDWEVLTIDGVDEASAAAILRRSLVFLCFSHREGFGLPPAEAMAAGCVVIGFDGFGGHELFRNHGVAVPEGDVVSFAQSAEGVLRDLDGRDSAFEEMRRRASDFVRSAYTIEQQASDAIRIFPSFQDAGVLGDRRVALKPFAARPGRWKVAGSHVKRAVAVLLSGARP
jgi:hypothetical protein